MKVLIFLLFSSFYLYAGGTDFRPFAAAKTLSLNGLYFAGSDGLSSIINNPAGLGYLTGKEIEIGIIDRLGQHEFNSPQIGLYKSYRKDNVNLWGGFYWNLSPGFTFAVSYGRIYDYYVDWPFALLGADNASILTFDMFNHFKIDAVSPSAALKIGNVTFGLALNLYNVHQESAFPQGNGASANGNGLYAYQFNYNQKAWTFGINFGIDYDISERFRVGASVKSGFKADLKGDAVSNLFHDVDSAAIKTNLSGQFEMPWIVGIGAVYNIAPDLNLNIDFSYSLYSSIQKSMSLKLENNIWQTGLSHVDSISGISGTNFPLKYKNKLDAGFGVELSAGEDVWLRAGYRYSQSPNSESTYNFLFPDVSEHTLSFGISLKEEPYTLDAAISYSFGMSTKVQNNNYSKFSGAYNSNSYVPTITFRYQL